MERLVIDYSLMRRENRRGRIKGRHNMADLAEVLKSALDLELEDRADLTSSGDTP